MAEPMRTSLAGTPKPGDEPETALELSERERMRGLMPAVEPDRTLDDWGRSERVERVFDETVVNFFYRYWFRAEVEGVENVPSEGGALLVSNHSGALPPDAAVIGKAIREEHPDPRPLYMTVEHFFKGYPGFSALLPKIGCVPAHPANVQRLLYDERRLVLVFPEGRKGTEKLVKDRYRVQRFGRGGFVAAALRTKTPIIPCSIVGAEEIYPIIGNAKLMARLVGAPYFPITPTFPWLGPLGMVPLPSKWIIEFGEPIRTDEFPDGAADDPMLVFDLTDQVRETIQQTGLHEMLAKRKSVWMG